MITVTDNRNSDVVKFASVAIGGTFLRGTTPYIRVEPKIINNSNVNAVCLTSGKHYSFALNAEVIEIDVEILITNRK